MKQYQAIIVDDERNIREALVLLLAEYCPEITICGTAVSAQEGRELLKTHEVDFIFLDISMPKEDGFAFLRSIPKGELRAYSSYKGNFAELNDGTRLSISRRKLNDFREAVKHFSKSLE